MYTKLLMDIGIIGGGIGGCLSAINLSKNSKYNITLFEKNIDILMGGPWCHLHAGGMLYPMISLDECKQLLKHSLLFAEFFSNCLLKRPTIIAYHKDEDKYNTLDLLHKCHIIKEEYILSKSSILGKPEDFYCIYTKEDIIFYKKNKYFNNKNKHNIYVSKFCDNLKDIDLIKYPFVSVNEFGIDMEKVKIKIYKLLQCENITLHLDYNINNLSKNKTKWIVNNKLNFDYIINSSGYKMNDTRPENIKVDKTFLSNNLSNDFLEMKCSWIIKTKVNSDYLFPEIAIIGERSTSRGMIQISPHISTNIFQVHLMTNYSTLFKDNSIQLTEQIIKDRTNITIKEITKVFPMFNDAEYYSKPLFGIQRIADKSKDKRADSVVFYDKYNYAEIQIVKGISSIFCSNQIVKKLN